MKRFLSVLLCAALTLMLLPAISRTASAESVSNFNIRLDEPIASYTPDFFPVFNTNATVYFSVTWQEDSPGFSAKLNSSDEFRAGLAYKVVIWIRLGDGNYFPVDGYGDLATAITVNGKAISSLKIEDRNGQNQITEVTITCEYDPLPGSEISSVLITGVPTPVAGNMPIFSFTLGSTSYGFYHTEPVVWWDVTDNRQMKSSDTFIKGHKYQLNIWLRANREGGFTFKTDSRGDPQVNVTLNSWAADSVTKAYEQEGREVIDIRYTFPDCQAPHTCAPKLVPQQDPTCLLPGFKAYYECSCGKCFEDAAGKKEITDMDGYGIIPAIGHTISGWRTTQVYHYTVCTTCGDMLMDEDHYGGTATCAEKGKCAVCGYAYLETNEDHTPDTSKWVARIDMYHFHPCKYCGAHCDIEEHIWSPTYLYQDSSGHAWVCTVCKAHSEIKAHNPGPEATETTPQTCKNCGYIIAPVKEHKHELVKVPQIPADCIHEGNIEYYYCTGCDDRFTDAAAENKIPEHTSVEVGALGHITSDSWSRDGEFHWRNCVTCAVVLDETRMLHEFENGKCSTCGYVQIQESEPAETTEPSQVTEPTQNTEPTANTETKPGTEPTTDKETAPSTDAPNSQTQSPEKEKNSNWATAVMIGLVCFGASVTATVVILKRKKK